MSKVRGVDATYYTTADIDRSTAFYSKLLGMEPATHMPGRLSEWVFEDDTTFGLYCQPSYKGSGSGSVMFAVEDVAASMAAAKALGSTFDDDDVTETPVCQMAFGRDPDNNQFILHHRLA